jgi:peptide/nickel transport system permease protein
MAVAEPFVSPGAQRRGLSKRSRTRLSGAGKIFTGATKIDRVGLVLLGILVLLAVLAPLIAPYNPIDPSGIPFTSPLHGGHLLGTDEVGYDIFSRVLFGLRTSLLGVLIVVSSGVIIGGTIGLVAGVAGGWLDTLLMRITDLFLALPGPLLAIAIAAALGPSYAHVLLSVSIVWWPFYARIMRGEIRALAARPHLEAAALAGAGPVRRGLRHLLPGAMPAIIVTASLDVGNLVVTLAGLSFLGLGAPAPAPELGAMAARGLQFLLQQWWVPVMPGIAVALLALAANLSGDAVADATGQGI